MDHFPRSEAKRSRADRLAGVAALLRRVLPGGIPIKPAASIARGPSIEAEPQALHSTPLPVTPPRAAVAASGGRFLSSSYGNHAGRREYKLYVPGNLPAGPAPLVVMLHGCTQSAADFAAGTRMNALAEEYGCFVVYPEQPAAANASKCWNWFTASHQRRGEGEPSIIAGITHAVMHEHAIDARRIYVAGLSAGAAEAAILGTLYPDLYAAIGVHSGLPFGAARNLPSAFSAMRNGAPSLARPAAKLSAAGAQRDVPAIVFHGDSDTTVHPSNGDQIIAQARTAGLRASSEQHRVPGGRAYSRTQHIDAGGVALFEQWVVHGAGHAWSGGSPSGSYTDPLGPDAAREMLRFFLDHVHPESAAESA